MLILHVHKYVYIMNPEMFKKINNQISFTIHSYTTHKDAVLKREIYWVKNINQSPKLSK